MTLSELFHLLREHLGLVIVLPILAAAVVGVYAFFLPDEYTASTTMYVLAGSGEQDTSASTQSELSAAQLISNDVSTLIKSDRIKDDAANLVNLTEAEAGKYKVSVTSATTTRIITLEVTGPDPRVAADLANAMVADTSEISRQVMGLESVNTIDQAVAPTDPSGPRRLLYVAVGFLGGLFVAVAIIVLMDMLNTRVRSGDEVEELLDGLSVIGNVPQIGR